MSVIHVRKCDSLEGVGRLQFGDTQKVLELAKITKLGVFVTRSFWIALEGVGRLQVGDTQKVLELAKITKLGIFVTRSFWIILEGVGRLQFGDTQKVLELHQKRGRVPKVKSL